MKITGYISPYSRGKMIGYRATLSISGAKQDSINAVHPIVESDGTYFIGGIEADYELRDKLNLSFAVIAFFSSTKSAEDALRRAAQRVLVLEEHLNRDVLTLHNLEIEESNAGQETKIVV
jgi:hypothetical protein